MARVVDFHRRAFLFCLTLVFGLVIRLISMFSLGYGHGLREVRNKALVVSDRAQLKQVALRFTRLHGTRRFGLPYRFGFASTAQNSRYLLRVANSYPFMMVESLGVYPAIDMLGAGLAEDMMATGSSCNSGGDGDGGGGGDGGWGGHGSSNPYCVSEFGYYVLCNYC